METNSVERTENRLDSRVELHLHTKMSDKDALVSVKDLFKTVKKWGHPAVAYYRSRRCTSISRSSSSW